MSKKQASRPESGASRKRRIRVRLRDRICRYCYIRPAETADHIVPLDRGGSDYLDNLLGCCDICNNNKKNMTLEEAGMVVLPRPVRTIYDDMFRQMAKRKRMIVDF